MKTLLTFALLALIGLLHHNSAAIVGPMSTSELCCLTVTRTAVPRRRIQNVEWSHSSCPVRAIIVTTARGKKICLDGSLNWVKKLLTEFEKSTPDSFNVSPSTN